MVLEFIGLFPLIINNSLLNIACIMFVNYPCSFSIGQYIYIFFLDMIRRRVLRTRSIKMLVLDEADEMLNKGFKEQIYDVYRYLPPATQVVLISATLPHEILEMTSKFMTDPIRILVKRFVPISFSKPHIYNITHDYLFPN